MKPKFKNSKCALMGCELPERFPTLGRLAKTGRFPSGLVQSGFTTVKTQANRLIAEGHFKKYEKICEDCFWK